MATLKKTRTGRLLLARAAVAMAVVVTSAVTLLALPASATGSPSITTTSLAAATRTQTGYSQTLTATGGTSPYTWSITTGTLPTGLSLNATSGAISGTVGSTAASETFTVEVTDATSATATQSLTITVNAVPYDHTSSWAGATETAAYSLTLAATGGTTPYTWSVSSGALPPGFSVNPSTGVISGTDSTTSGSYSFTTMVTDSNGVTSTQNITLTVNPVPSILTTTLPSATRSAAYSQAVAIRGGTGDVVSISAGTLPSGLTLNSSSAVISGTVGSTATSETFTFKFTDNYGVYATQVLTITVNAAPSITTTSLAATTRTASYSKTLTSTGGTSPLAWSISSGILPTGLTLNSSTGAIAGTVGTAATSETFTAKVTDANGATSTKSLAIVVNALPSVTTTSLAAATRTQTGYSQTLGVTGGTGPFTWSVSTGSLPTGLTLNSSTGAITGTVGSAATSETFTAKATDTDGVAATESLTLTVNAVPYDHTSSWASATQTAAYSLTLAATGGTTPYTWSISSGSLPPGFALNSSTGVISGTDSTTSGSYSFTTKATDANGVTSTQSITGFSVNPVPSISTTTLTSATRSAAYSRTVGISGGTGNYDSVSAGTLPSGLSLNSSTGVISGTVGSMATSETFTFKDTDNYGVYATQVLTISVVANTPTSVTNQFVPQDGCNCADPVDMATGSLSESYNDISIPGPGGGLNFTRGYDSLNDADLGPLGYGWADNYQMSLATDLTAGTVTVTEATSATITFTDGTVAGTYNSPPDVEGTLSSTGSGTSVVYTLQQELLIHLTCLVILVC